MKHSLQFTGNTEHRGQQLHTLAIKPNVQTSLDSHQGTDLQNNVLFLLYQH